jgi:hypothetical protein
MVVAMGEAANRMDDSQDKDLDMDGLGVFVRKDGSDLRITALSGGFSASKA